MTEARTQDQKLKSAWDSMLECANAIGDKYDFCSLTREQCAALLFEHAKLLSAKDELSRVMRKIHQPRTR